MRKLLDELGIAYEVAPSIVRGLDYYARTVWEFQPLDAGGQSTIGAGGRYDGLIEMLGGPPTPGTGFASGLERIVLEVQKSEPDLGSTAPDAFTIPLGESGPAVAAKLAADTDGFSGAELESLCHEAKISALRDGNFEGATPVKQKHFQEALRKITDVRSLVAD